MFDWANSDGGGGGGGRRQQGFPLLLFLAKSFCFLDGEEQLLFQLFEAFVGRQVQTVKTAKQQQEGGGKCCYCMKAAQLNIRSWLTVIDFLEISLYSCRVWEYVKHHWSFLRGLIPPRLHELTTCGSEEATCPSPPSQCRTSAARCFLQRKDKQAVRWDAHICIKQWRLSAIKTQTAAAKSQPYRGQTHWTTFLHPEGQRSRMCSQNKQRVFHSQKVDYPRATWSSVKPGFRLDRSIDKNFIWEVQSGKSSSSSCCSAVVRRSRKERIRTN